VVRWAGSEVGSGIGSEVGSGIEGVSLVAPRSGYGPGIDPFFKG
jgi:hypothetical protein